MEIGWPSMAASASMPPTPQPRTAAPLTMVVWLSVPTKRVRIGNLFAVLVLVGPNRLGEVFKIDLVADASAGWDNAEVVKGVLTPFEECVALHVALIFAVNVHLERARVAKFIDHDRVVNRPDQPGSAG